MLKIQKVYTVIPFPIWGIITCLLPLFGFILCVLIAITFHFDEATKTHCNVWNFLPSISAAVGDSTPERYIWRFCIAYHCLPRTVIIPSFYWTYYAEMAQQIKQRGFDMAFRFAIFLHVLENLALVSLTFVSSSENYSIHEKSFITFMVSATLYMLLTIYIQQSARKVITFNSAQERAFTVKVFACLTNISVFIFSIYLFLRHNTHCEPGSKSFSLRSMILKLISFLNFSIFMVCCL